MKKTFFIVTILFCSLSFSIFCQEISRDSNSISHWDSYIQKNYSENFKTTIFYSEIKEDDSIKINNYSLIFKKIDSVYLPPYKYDKYIPANICDSIYNGYECASKIENNLSNRLNKFFKRNGDELLIFLDNKDTIKFIDRKETADSPESIVGYTFRNYFEEIEYYLVYAYPYEGMYNVLINKKNGNSRIVNGDIYISPSLKWIASINCFPFYSINGFELLKIAKDSLNPEFIFSPQFSLSSTKADSSNIDWGPVDMKWLTDDKIILKIKYETEGRLLNINDKYVLSDKRKSWLLLTIK